jgi:hypothetical protein
VCSASISPGVLARWNELEVELVHRPSVPIPLYFIVENEQFEALYADILRFALSLMCQFVVVLILFGHACCLGLVCIATLVFVLGFCLCSPVSADCLLLLLFFFSFHRSHAHVYSSLGAVAGNLDPFRDLYRLQASASSVRKVKALQATNVQGWLSASSSSSFERISKSSSKTIALVAYYDSFAAAPSMATGAGRCSNLTHPMCCVELGALVGISTW